MSKNTRAANSSTIEPRLVNREDAASFLSVSPRLLDTLVQRGEIAPVRVPGVRRIAYDTHDLNGVVQRWKSAGAA